MSQQQVTPQEVIARLNRLSDELSDLSDWLHKAEVQLEGVSEQYEKFVDEYELGLLVKSEQSEYKLPAEKLRLKLARSKMDPDLLGKYIGLSKKRDRLETRIRNIRLEIDAQRSILSALKVLEEI